MKDMEQRGDGMWKMFCQADGCGDRHADGGELGMFSALMSDNRSV